MRCGVSAESAAVGARWLESVSESVSGFTEAVVSEDIDDLLGCPTAFVYAIGRLALISAQLEIALRHVYVQCGGKGSMGNASKMARRLRDIEPKPLELPAPPGPPVVVRGDVVSAVERVAWCNAVTDAMKARGELMHSAPMLMQLDGDWVLATRDVRPGTVTALDTDAVEELVSEVARLTATGFEFLHRITAAILWDDQQRLMPPELRPLLADEPPTR